LAQETGHPHQGYSLKDRILDDLIIAIRLLDSHSSIGSLKITIIQACAFNSNAIPRRKQHTPMHADTATKQ
jgi:hypothetical protein